MSAVDEVGFSCAACGKQYRWKPELAEKKVKCKCGNALAVPAVPPTPGRAAARANAVQPGLAAAARTAEVRPRVAAAAPAGRPANVPPPPPPPPPAPSSRRPQDTSEDDGGMDALYALAQQEADVAEDATAGADLNFCPNCRNRMNPDAVLCTACGYNRKSGKMVSAAAPKVAKPGGGFLGKFKKGGDAKAVDKMAPQGSFLLGLALSFGFAVAASVLWCLVAWGTGRELAFLVCVIGAAAGVGMQVGQKGYSRLGGFAAAGITVVVMILARIALIVAIIGTSNAASLAAGDDEEPAADTEDIDGPIRLTDEYGGTKDPKSMIMEEAEKAAKRKARQQAEWDRQAAEEQKKNPTLPPPDPLLVEKLTDDFMANEMKIDKNFATPDQHNAAFLHATERAKAMPLADREKVLAPLKVKRDRERAESELLSLATEHQFEEAAKKNPALRGPVAWTSAGDVAKQKLEQMSPEEKKAELARLKEWGKARAAEAKKEWAAEEKKMKEEEAKAAVDDGLGEEAPAAPAANPASAPAAVAAGGGDADGLGGDGDAVAAAPAAPADNADPDADPDEDGGDEVAASGGSAASATASKGTGGDSSSSDSDSGMGAGGSILFGTILFLILIGGIKPAIFLIGALLLAYRTAAGATWG
jgi:hypothetical protein